MKGLSPTPMQPATPKSSKTHPGTAFGYPRDFRDNRFIYMVISPRARGLSLGVNMNPDKWCNFDCPYCEVNRQEPSRTLELDVEQMAEELRNALKFVLSGGVKECPRYQTIPADLLRLRHVTLSGDGEPTFCPKFKEAVNAVVHLRATAGYPFFKLVLVTNASGLHLPAVQKGLDLLTTEDEIWAKLDAGTQSYMNEVNRPGVSLEKILHNILFLARKRPVTIQGLFVQLNGKEPPEEEIVEYARRVKELKDQGARISLVQIYSATRPTTHSECSHLSLKSLSRIAHTVRDLSGVKAEVF